MEGPLPKTGDANAFPPLQKWSVKKIDRKIADPFVKAHHYSERLTSGGGRYFGGYTNDELYCVAQYARPPAQMVTKEKAGEFLKKLTDCDVTADNHLELVRLCRSGGWREGDWTEPLIPMTWFVAKCHKFLKKEGIRFILSFSDPAFGHEGTIYKAANFTNLGKSAPVYHVKDKDGNLRHRRVAYRYKENFNHKTYGAKPWPDWCMSIAEARNLLGFETVRTQPKDRWFLKL